MIVKRQIETSYNKVVIVKDIREDQPPIGSIAAAAVSAEIFLREGFKRSATLTGHFNEYAFKILVSVVY